MVHPDTISIHQSSYHIPARAVVQMCSTDAKTIDSRGVVGDVFLLAGRQVHEVPLLRVEQLEEESALVRVAQVPRHVERRPRLQSCPNITCKTVIR